MKSKLFLLLAAVAATLVVSTGCGSPANADLPKDEQVKFKGGPIPPGVLEKMKADAAKRAAQQLQTKH